MKVLITNMHKFNGGGHVTYIKSLLAGLPASYDITVATPATSRLYRQAGEIAGIRVIGQPFTSRVRRMLPELFGLRRLLKREQFDVVHVNGASDHRHVMLASLGLVHRPAIIWTKHNTKSANSFGNRLRAWMGTSACIAVCEAVARILRQSPYAGRPIETVRLGLGLRRFPALAEGERDAARAAYCGEDHAGLLVLGSVAGTDYEKGWLDLVAAVARLEPALRDRVRIIVAGDPPPERHVALVRELGMLDHVLLPGLLPDIRPVLAASDVGFVLSYEEAASYACLESMAMGLPSLVTDVGGLPENVRDGRDGWVVPAGDIQHIEALVRRLLAGEFDLRQLGESARRRVASHFSTARLCRETETVYRHAVSGAAIMDSNSEVRP
jgi:glycosyltransferase involved in cell wall biosynthesis